MKARKPARAKRSSAGHTVSAAGRAALVSLADLCALLPGFFCSFFCSAAAGIAQMLSTARSKRPRNTLVLMIIPRGFETQINTPSASDPAVSETVLLQVALVVLLRPKERRGRKDLRDDRALVFPAFLEVGLRLGCCGLLRRRMEEDRGAVLLAHVRPLEVQRRRVVVLPEDVPTLLVGDTRRV